MSLADSDGAIRAWINTKPSVTALCGDRIMFAMPRKDRPTLPMIVMYRVGGTADSYAMDRPQVIFECWGSNKLEATTLGRTLAYAIAQSVWEPPVLVTYGQPPMQALVLNGEMNLGPILNPGTDYASRTRLDATFQLRSA